MMSLSKRARRRNMKTRSLDFSNSRYAERRRGPLSHSLSDKATPPSACYISPENIRYVSPGCIVWLPAREYILPHASFDRRLHRGAFNHPAIILSVPRPLAPSSIVDIAIVSPQIPYSAIFTIPDQRYRWHLVVAARCDKRPNCLNGHVYFVWKRPHTLVRG